MFKINYDDSNVITEQQSIEKTILTTQINFRHNYYFILYFIYYNLY